MSKKDNLNFVPKSISAVAICAGENNGFRIAIGIVQRTTAIRAYNSFVDGRDWMEKLSIAYVVALATRSADTLLMQHLQNCVQLDAPFVCVKCREATIGLDKIRGQMFPVLAKLRTHANELIHHLDHPENQGISTLNIEGVFNYCYHLFQENAEVLMGVAPTGELKFTQCKSCRAKAI